MTLKVINEIWSDAEYDLAISLIDTPEGKEVTLHDLEFNEGEEEENLALGFHLALQFDTASQAVEQLEAIEAGIRAVIDKLSEDEKLQELCSR